MGAGVGVGVGEDGIVICVSTEKNLLGVVCVRFGLRLEFMKGD